MRPFDHPHHRTRDFVFAHQHKFLQAFPKNLLRHSESGAVCQSFSKGCVWSFDQTFCSPRFRGGWSRFGLDSNHPNLRVDRICGNANACSSAASANWNNNHIKSRFILEHLQRLGCYTGDQQRFIPGVDVSIAVLRGKRLAVKACVVEAFTVENYLSPHSSHRSDLARVGGFRDPNASFDAEQLRSIGYRLPVIPCRSGNHASRFLFVVELRNEIYSAAHLERADWLIVLVLNVDFGAYQLVDRRIRMHWGTPEIRLNTTSRY